MFIDEENEPIWLHRLRFHFWYIELRPGGIDESLKHGIIETLKAVSNSGTSVFVGEENEPR